MRSLKVPQTWLEQAEVRKSVDGVVGRFLSNTERIVSVVVYATVMMEIAGRGMMLIRHRFHEFLNVSHRFDTSVSWGLFKDFKVPDDWGGMPPKWARVFSQGFIVR